MVQKLAKKELVSYQKYKGVRLTTEGKTIALKIKRRHELAELFLETVLRLPPDEVHQVACWMEHNMTDHMEAALSEILGDPKVGPGGDPIPPTDIPSEVLDVRRELALLPLGRCEAGMSGSIQLLLLGGETLEFLGANGIFSGSEVEVLEQKEDTLRVRSGDHDLSLTQKLADRILIQPDR
jgi:DtxR family Mn-dependent transcriptional regulator